MLDPASMSSSGYRYFRRHLDDLLLSAWDPIGVNDMAEAKDEYLSYSAKISDMLMAGRNVDEVYVYLRGIECDHMGLSITNAERTKTVAEHAASIFRMSCYIR